MPRATIECGTHGRAERVIACVHVAGEPHALFILPAGEEGPATAWCGLCEAARLQDHGWYDYADGVAQWRLICSGCLDAVVQRVAAVRPGDVTVIAYDETTPEQKPD